MSGTALRMLISSIVLFVLIVIASNKRHRDWTQIVMWTLAAQVPQFILIELFPEIHSIFAIAGAMIVGVILVVLYLFSAYGIKTALVVGGIYIAFKIIVHAIWRHFMFNA